MIVSCFKSFLTGFFTILLAGCFVFAGAQTPSDKQISLSERITNVTRSLPKEILPPASDVKLYPVRPGLFADGPLIFEVAAPDKKTVAGTIDGALYIRRADGEEKKIIVKPPDAKRWDIEGALWSPNGKLIAVKLIDDTGVPLIPLVKWTGKREEVLMKPYLRAGDKVPLHQLYIVDIASGKITAIQHGESDPYFYTLDWNASGDSLYFLRSDRLTRRLDLLTANAETGKVTPVFSETNKFGAQWWSMLGTSTPLSDANPVQILANGNFIWTSERSGFAHLYLYDQNGRLMGSLTEGKNLGYVRRLVKVDEKRGYIYLITQGADENDLYKQTLYRFRLNGGTAEKLAEASQLQVNFSPDMDKLWVLRKSAPDLYQVETMNNDGSGRQIFWKADISFLKDYGFAPEYLNVLAADGKTKVRCLVIKPKDFDPKKSYPVIEDIYAAPYANNISDSFTSNSSMSGQDLANRGFIVMLIDGRGTQGRGQAFHNYAAGRFGQVEIADHAAVLRQLGKERSYMDLSRVGITGSSWGGYFTLRALLLEPELYKAGVISSAATDLSSFRVSVEPFMGCLPADCPAAYKAGDNIYQIDKLKAPLLIIHGTADDDVPVAESFKLVEALQKTGKEHELILLFGITHSLRNAPLSRQQKTAEFFEKHFLKMPKQLEK